MITPKHFPAKGIGSYKISVFLLKLLLKVKEVYKKAGLSELVSPVQKKYLLILTRIAILNTNNHGNWTERNTDPLSTYGLEKGFIKQMLNLYKADNRGVVGYITSGATEGNLFMSWVGVKFMERKKIKRSRMVMLNTSLTHHSIDKSADITGIKIRTVALNETTWALDLKEFENTVRKLVTKGAKGFLVPLTLGYTLTGSSDNFVGICNLIDKVQKIYGIHFFVWLDAAFNGMIEPFMNSNFTPFKNKHIQGFITDLHKFGYAPIPSGVVLYRRNLSNLIDTPVKYLKFRDSTLLGSRPGASAVYSWTAVNSLGKKGFKEKILQNIKRMYKFAQKHSGKGITFILSPNSLNCGVVVNSLGYNELNFQKKYGLEFMKTKLLFRSGVKEVIISKCFFNRDDKRT